VFFSWRGLLSEQPANRRELRRFIEIKPVLDYAALMLGERASNFIRDTARNLGLSPKFGVTVRLTGGIFTALRARIMRARKPSRTSWQ
jgi:uncharacterized protein